MGGIFGGGDPYAGGGAPPIPDPAPAGGYDPYAYGAYGSGVGGDYGGGGYGAPPIPGPAPSGGYGSAYGAYGDPTQRGFFERAGDWLGSEKGQRALEQLGGFSTGLLQGSGPSLQPRNFYSALGQAGEGMQKAGSQYYEDALRRAQVGKVGAETSNLQQQMELDRQIAQMNRQAMGMSPYGPGGMPPVQAPVGAGGETSGSGGRGGWGPLAQPAIGALSAAGVSLAGQQAIMGHGLAEGGFNVPWNVGDSGNSFGHWQFNKGGELPGFMAWAQGKGNPQDTALQAQYVAKRMEEIHPGFSKVTDPAQAMAMVADFERYKGYQTNKRLGYLADAQKAMGGGELPERMPIPAAPGQKPTFADTMFQMPPNMAAGLGGPQGILPQVGAAPVPGAMQPQAGVPLASALRPPVAPGVMLPQASVATPGEPAATSGSSTPAATARVAVAGAPSLAEGDSIAYGFQKYGNLPGNPKGGRNPEQVLENINGNLDRDPDYYRGKTVILSSGVMNGAKRIDLVPEQIQRIQDAGGKVILAGVDTGKFAGHNSTLAQMAADAGVPFAGALPTNNVHPGPDGYRQYLARVQRGAERVTAAAPVVDAGQGATAGGGGAPAAAPAVAPPAEPIRDLSGLPAPVVGAGRPPAPPPAAVSPAPPAAPPPIPGAMVRGGAVPPPAAAAGAPVVAAPALTRGTAPGMPIIPPEPIPPPATPAPPVGATAAPPRSVPGAAMPPAAPPAPGGATGLPPIPPLPAVPPLPGAGGVPGAPQLDPNYVRLNQQLALTYAQRGRTPPGFVTKAAELPLAGIQAGEEARAKQPYALQSSAYNAVLDAWKAGPVAAAQAAAQQPYELQKIFAKDASQLEREWDTPQRTVFLDDNGDKHETFMSPRQMAGGQGPEIMRGVPGAPGGAAPGGAPGGPAGRPTELGEASKARIEGDKTAWSSVNQQYTQANNLRPLLDQVIETANKTPSGWAVPIGRVMATALSTVGIPISENLSNAEAMKSISQALIPTVRQPGAQSNAEMVNYLSTVPGLAQSPAGRIQIANMNKAMIDRLGEIAEVRRSNLGAADLDEKLKALDAKPLFTPVQRAVMVAGMGQRAPTPAEFDLLPVGIEFTNSKGQRVPKKANRTPAE